MHRKTDWSENRKDDTGEMSFSGMVKEELSRNREALQDCRTGGDSVLLRKSRTFSPGRKTENPDGK